MSARASLRLALALGASLVFSCGSSGGDLDRLDWLVGMWQGETHRDAQFFEIWTVSPDGAMRGLGFQVETGDTVFGEELRIEERDGRLHYVADVASNEGEVAFGLVRQTSFESVFENPEHDFPQRFIYRRRLDGTLYVAAENLDGKRKLEFFFKKVSP